ncbi:hypothetical protein BOTBODRAFT_196432 [Botryobasidium botryosum FD-172 SS1]|uniref:Uncharacterized protein n=1 Tax=Botryobasidium botryosum (strain FD-172 SS1) TaxID=930990 RepID=A0A067N047_BOTB1|nr:hypothetical protein BOTBODRAFT_196432 [Botryobasidium botryosum FD-172 SS1]
MSEMIPMTKATTSIPFDFAGAKATQYRIFSSIFCASRSCFSPIFLRASCPSMVCASIETLKLVQSINLIYGVGHAARRFVKQSWSPFYGDFHTAGVRTLRISHFPINISARSYDMAIRSTRIQKTAWNQLRLSRSMNLGEWKTRLAQNIFVSPSTWRTAKDLNRAKVKGLLLFPRQFRRPDSAPSL